MNPDIFSGTLAAHSRLWKTAESRMEATRFLRFIIRGAQFTAALESVIVIWKRLCSEQEEAGRAFAAWLDAVKTGGPEQAAHAERWAQLHNPLRVDMASLFIFGKILLDKWTLLLSRVLDARAARGLKFRSFTRFTETLPTVDLTDKSPWPAFRDLIGSDVPQVTRVWTFLRDEFIAHGGNDLYPTLWYGSPPTQVHLRWEAQDLSDDERRILVTLRDSLVGVIPGMEAAREEHDILALLLQERYRICDTGQSDEVDRVLRSLGTRSPDLNETTEHLASLLERSLAYLEANV